MSSYEEIKQRMAAEKDQLRAEGHKMAANAEELKDKVSSVFRQGEDKASSEARYMEDESKNL